MSMDPGRTVNVWNVAFAQEAAAPAQGAPTGPVGPGMGMWLFLIVFFAIFYFLIMRPNQKREKERRDMLSALSKGDRVVTTGGIFGTIIGLNEKTAVLKVSDEPAVKMEVLRGAISQVVHREDKVQES